MAADENTSLDFSKLSDAQLTASLNDEPYGLDDEGDEDLDEAADDDTAQAAAGQEPAAGDDAGQQDTKEEGEPKLVDLRALHEARAETRQEREARQALEAEVARYRQAEADARARQQSAEVQATYEQILTEQGEDAAAAYINHVTQQRESQLQQEFAQTQALNTFLLSEEMVREVHPDYDTRFDRMREVLGERGMAAVVDRALAESPRSPAKWLFNYSKTHFPTAEDQQALINAEVTRQLAELQSKAKPPAVRGHQTIGHMSSGTQNPGAKKPVRKMSDAELERSLYD